MISGGASHHVLQRRPLGSWRRSETPVPVLGSVGAIHYAVADVGKPSGIAMVVSPGPSPNDRVNRETSYGGTPFMDTPMFVILGDHHFLGRVYLLVYRSMLFDPQWFWLKLAEKIPNPQTIVRKASLYR